MDFLDKVKMLHSQGLNDREIAEQIGYSANHITQTRKFKLNLPSQSKIRVPKLKSEIRKLHDLGYSDLQIARELGISPSSAQWNRKRLDLDTHNPENTYETEEDRIKGYMIRNVKYSAKRRGIEFDLHYKDIILNERCPLLNIPLKFRTEKGFNDNDRATLDRIDNDKGYVRGNVWVISRLANSMKNEASFDQLELFCKNTLEFLENHRALGGITHP